MKRIENYQQSHANEPGLVDSEANTIPVHASGEEFNSQNISEVHKQPNIKSKTRKNLSRIALGLIAAGGIYALAEQPSSTLHEVEKAAPVVGGGAIASEVMWDVGAIMMAIGVGSKIGNPLTIRNRWDEIGKTAVNNRLTKAGLTINTIGALSLSGFMVYGGTKLSPELWPGVGGVVTLDVLSTIAIRTPIVAAMRSPKSESEATIQPETLKKTKPKIRTAKLKDIDRLAEIDIKLYKRAYGSDLPNKSEVYEMLKQRYLNNPDWMFVAEVDNQIEGFVSAFPTNKPLQSFTSWEDSTANGTLKDRIDPKGKYLYITNMTINSEAVKLGAEEMLLGKLLAKGIAYGVEYGYFVSRMPSFKRWAIKNNIDLEDSQKLNQAALEYSQLRRNNGKLKDPELRMYESLGYSLEKLVPNGFSDEASLNFGVVCRVDNPVKNRFTDVMPVRKSIGYVLNKLSNYPKIMEKIA